MPRRYAYERRDASPLACVHEMIALRVRACCAFASAICGTGNSSGPNSALEPTVYHGDALVKPYHSPRPR
eukprot:scaffold48410_cov75-Phaeocystis_antarctica.AAC.1